MQVPDEPTARHRVNGADRHVPLDGQLPQFDAVRDPLVLTGTTKGRGDLLASFQSRPLLQCQVRFITPLS